MMHGWMFDPLDPSVVKILELVPVGFDFYVVGVVDLLLGLWFFFWEGGRGAKEDRVNGL